MPFPPPAQMPPRGLGARLRPSFLVRSRTGAAETARPDERSSRPMTARVTAPFQARAKPGAAKQGKPKQAAAASVAPKGPQSTRKAQLILSRIEPWSVMKFSFMISLVGWVILFVAVSVLYFVLSKSRGLPLDPVHRQQRDVRQGLAARRCGRRMVLRLQDSRLHDAGRRGKRCPDHRARDGGRGYLQPGDPYRRRH